MSFEAERYTLHVSGRGQCAASSIGRLQLRGRTIEHLLRTTHSGAFWLDIESPTASDMQSIVRVFQIDPNIARPMRQAMQAPGRVEPCSHRSRDELYVCWAEPLLTEHGAQAYCDEQHMELARDPPWLAGKPGLRQRRLDKLRRLLDTSRAHAIGGDRQRWIVRRWGYERWRDLLHKDYQERMIRRNSLQAPTMSNIDMLAHQTSIVHIWTRGRVVLTLHARGSQAIANARQLPGATPEAILQGIVGHWVHRQSCLRFLHRHADALAERTMRECGGDPDETLEWASAAQRSHKLSLWLLRHAQSCTHVLARLNSDRAFAALLNEQTRVAESYSHVERQLAQLSRVLFARLRQRLLLAGRSILDAMNVCLVAHIVGAPLQLWANLDNLNGITTPGRLLSTGAMFYWQFVAFGLWAAFVWAAYRVYLRRSSVGKVVSSRIKNVY